MHHFFTMQKERVSDYRNSNNGLRRILGSGSFIQQERGLILDGEVILIDPTLSAGENQEIEYVFEALNDFGGMGFVFSANDHSIQSISNVESAKRLYDTSIWHFEKIRFPFRGKMKTPRFLRDIQRKKSDFLAEDGTPLLMRNGIEHVFKLRISGNTITLCADGLVLFEKTLSCIQKIETGFVGIKLNPEGKILLKSITTRGIPAQEDAGVSDQIILQSGGVSATIDKTFPRIIAYGLDGHSLSACCHTDNMVRIDATRYPASATLTEIQENRAVYRVCVPCLNIHFFVRISIEEDGRIRETLYDIDDRAHPVISLGLSAALLSVRKGTPSHAAYSTGFEDCYYNLAVGEKPEGCVQCTIPIVYTEHLAASMYNSAISNLSEFECYVHQEDAAFSICFGNSDFVYRSIDRAQIVAEKFYTDIILTGDANGDGNVDWQDAACALRKIIPSMNTNASFSNGFVHMAYNFASGLQQPFLKIADNLVRFANLTDRFPQILLVKGYASEGHDSGHCDYGDISARAGGAKDFSALLSQAHQWNAIVGVHINHTEAYPEAAMYSEELVSAKKGWLWLDQSYYLRRDVDIATGQMQERLAQLFHKAPALDFVYVDTYRDGRHNAARLAQELVHKHQTLLATEEGSRLVKWIFWAHCPVFGDGIHRFVYHTKKDIYKNSLLLRGGYDRGKTDSFMGWGSGNSIYSCLSQFFTNQLPQKYLMRFELKKMTEEEAFFEGGVHTRNVGGVNYIFKDKKLIARGDLIFIPWSAEPQTATEKIYHWNPVDGKTTWSLPDEWRNISEAFLYLCTQRGKELVQKVPVVNGTITIEACAKTPYVIYPKETPEISNDWSQESLIKDMGFNERDFTVWKADGEAGYEEDENGVSMLTLRGNGACRVSQSLQGLMVGKRYRIGVWACAPGKKEATLTVEYGQGRQVCNSASGIRKKCKIEAHYAFDKFARYLTVDFLAEQSHAQIILSACAHPGIVQFFDCRIEESDPMPRPDGAVAWEDFENTFAPYGIFVPLKPCSYSHLSTTHEGYTQDTISGKHSLKAATAFYTTPSSVALNSHTNYKITFQAIGKGVFRVRSDSTGKTVFRASFKTGQNEFVFSTGKYKDCIFGFHGKKPISDHAKFILDNVLVTKY